MTATARAQGATNAASQGEVDTGTEADKFVSPLTLAGSRQAGMVKILTQTASSDATIDFDNLLTSEFSKYEIIYEGVVPATDDASLFVRVGTGATPTYQATTYQASSFSIHNSAGNNTGVATLGLQITDQSATWGVDNTASNGGAGGSILVLNTQDSGKRTTARTSNCHPISSSQFVESFAGGVWATTTIVTSLRVFFDSGDIATGTFTLFAFK